MCGICGCSSESHHHHHDHSGDNHHHDHASTANVDQYHIRKVEQSLFALNQHHADKMRSTLAKNSIFSLNLLSSPGSGKTTLLVDTLKAILPSTACYVIEGDQQTSLDADRIAATGAPAFQVNTGHACHLDAHRVESAMASLAPKAGATLFVENVGNLVCPSNFDLGEAKRIVLLSVTEGDDKPLKYPDIFLGADLVLLTKIDLLPHVDFDVDKCKAAIHKLNGTADIIELSVKSGMGMDSWYQWLASRHKKYNDDIAE